MGNMLSSSQDIHTQEFIKICMSVQFPKDFPLINNKTIHLLSLRQKKQAGKYKHYN